MFYVFSLPLQKHKTYSGMYHNLIKVAAAIPTVKIADCKTNAQQILALIDNAASKGVEIICFPELSITSYTCGDLFLNSALIKSAEKALSFLLEQTKHLNIIALVGMPVMANNQLFNCAVAFRKGNILGVVPKTYLPNNNEFYEHRWFATGMDTDLYITLADQRCRLCAKTVFSSLQFGFSIEICEDLWAVVPPSSFQALQGSHIIFNLSASNEIVGKNEYRRNLVTQQSGRCNAGYVYVSSGFGESSTDLLFASSAIIAENGSILAESERFAQESQLLITEIDIDRLKCERLKNDSFKHNQQNDYNSSFYNLEFETEYDKPFEITRYIEKHPFIPKDNLFDTHCKEIFDIQSNALAVRLMNTDIKKAVIGISGGLDSSLALMVTTATFDKLKMPRTNIIGITMPGFGTTRRTKDNSISLMHSLGITAKEISIEKAVLQHFEDIGQNIDNHNTTYENSQARERTQILMDIANKENALVIGTGDMSELALGWCTYNGDHMSMYGVNSGIPKTLVKHLIKWIALNNTEKEISDILFDILNTPISPELIPHNNNEIVQKTEDVVGPYELHDFFLYYFLRFGYSFEKILLFAKKAFAMDYSDSEIEKWLNIFFSRFFRQQFKRSCMPDGIKVGSVDLSPRGSLRMASDIGLSNFDML